jgi:alpha-1,6-mannosyltransferase
MKICDVTQFYSPVSGGVKRYLHEKIDFLRQFTDHEHVLIVPGPANTTQRDGRFTVHHVRAMKVSWSSHYRMVLDTQTVEHLIEQERPDLIEAGCPYQLAWSSLRVGQRIHIPVVGFYHSHFPESYVRTVTRFLGGTIANFFDGVCYNYIRRLYNQFHATFVSSPKLQGILQGVGVENTEIIPLGVETDVFEPGHRSDALRKNIGLGSHQLLLLFVGRLSREKNIDCLLKAFEIIQQYTGDKFALLIVGEGAERPKVLEAASRLKNLHSLPYEGDPHKLATLYASADLFVHAGLCETFGLVVLESQACGVPAVAFSNSGMDANIFGGADFLAIDRTPEGLAKAVLKAYQNDIPAVGRMTRQAVMSHYPWKVVFKRLVETYERIVGDYPKAAHRQY